jgi:preprotein translocase SecE subunit
MASTSQKRPHVVNLHPPNKTATVPGKENLLSLGKAYFVGVRQEWGKVSWPTWVQIWGETLVVLVVVTIVTMIVFSMDWAFKTIIGLIVPA